MSGACILHVEDDSNDVLFLNLAFEKAGITMPVLVATDGQLAIDYLSGAGGYANRKEFPRPCLVLLDLKLPRKSGFEVLAWIRSQPALRRLVVIVLTSAEHEQDVARAYDLGANSYVIKPMDLAEREETARLLKGWWLGCNRFASLGEEAGSSNV